MAEIYVIGDESDNYGEIETDIPVDYLKNLISKHMKEVILSDLSTLVSEINKLGYHAAKRDVIYLHLPCEIKDYGKKVDNLLEEIHNETKQQHKIA